MILSGNLIQKHDSKLLSYFMLLRPAPIVGYVFWVGSSRHSPCVNLHFGRPAGAELTLLPLMRRPTMLMVRRPPCLQTALKKTTVPRCPAYVRTRRVTETF